MMLSLFSTPCGSCFNISQSFQGFRNRTEISVDAQSTLLMHSGEILAGFLCWLWGGSAGHLGSLSGSFPIPSLGHFYLYWFPLAACFGEIILTAVFTNGARRDSFSLRAVVIRSTWHKGWNLDGGLRDWPSRGRRRGSLRVSAPLDSRSWWLFRGTCNNGGPEPGLLHPGKAPKPYLWGSEGRGVFSCLFPTSITSPVKTVLVVTWLR